MNKAAIRRAASIINKLAKGVFDACEGLEPFACGTCVRGNEVCKRNHAKMVKTVKDLRAMVRR